MTSPREMVVEMGKRDGINLPSLSWESHLFGRISSDSSGLGLMTISFLKTQRKQEGTLLVLI